VLRVDILSVHWVTLQESGLYDPTEAFKGGVGVCRAEFLARPMRQTMFRLHGAYSYP